MHVSHIVGLKREPEICKPLEWQCGHSLHSDLLLTTRLLGKNALENLLRVQQL